VRKILGTLGKLGKGAATIAGGVLGIGGVSLGGTDILGCVDKLTKSAPDVLTAAGLALLIFGLGRKAGFVAGNDTKQP
jgi:hypothetical protein